MGLKDKIDDIIKEIEGNKNTTDPVRIYSHNMLSYAELEEPEFNYNLERMKKATESETVHLPPNIKSSGEIREWLLNCKFETDKED